MMRSPSEAAESSLDDTDIGCGGQGLLGVGRTLQARFTTRVIAL